MRKKKIKILHVAQAAGGVDRYIRMLLKYLDKEKFENILVCSQDFNREDYDGLVDSFEQIEMNRAIGVSDLNSIKEVRRLIKKYNPDIDWIYQGLEEYGYITGRSVVIKCISLALLVVFVKTREDYVAYALLTSLALGGNYIFNVIHARKMVGFTLVNLKIRKHMKKMDDVKRQKSQRSALLIYIIVGDIEK